MVAPASGQPIRLAAITDEFSPDIDVALDAMRSVGMTGVELRTVGGRNVVDLSDSEIAKIAAAVTVRGMEIVSIASPLLWATSRRTGINPASCRFASNNSCVSSSVSKGAARYVTEPTFMLAADAGIEAI